MRWFLLTTTVALVIGAAPAAALAATYTIDRTTDTSAAASRCTKSGRLVCNSLRAFVLQAPSNSTAQLRPGTYSLTSGKLLFNRSGVVLTVKGSSRGTTIRQSTAGSRVIEVDGETLVLNRLTVTGGNIVGKSVDANGDGSAIGGGGIANSGSLTLEVTTVSGNSVTGARGRDGTESAPAGTGGMAHGGGVDNLGTLAIDDSTIQDNTATGGAGGDGPTAGAGASGEGGGIGNGPGGVLVIGQGSKVLANAATGGAGGGSGGQPLAAGGPGAGGGVWSEGTAYISADTFSDNVAQAGASSSTPSVADGGAIYANDGTLEVQASTITDNHATTNNGTAAGGGGAVASGTQTTIENSTLAGNTTTGNGGGIDAFGDGQSIISSTLSDNSAGSGGGNLAVSRPVDLEQTIITGGVASSGAGNCSGPVTDKGHNLESTAPSQCGLSAAEQDLIGQDPLLGPLAYNGGPTQTTALLPGSPAIDAGGNCANEGGYALTVDQRASVRGGPCDIGAFEIRLVPSNQSPPSVSGLARAGHSLACRPGTWSSPDALSYAYVWLRSGRAIHGATSGSYRVTTRDAGRPLRCRVTAKNDDGYSSPQTSQRVWAAHASAAARTAGT